MLRCPFKGTPLARNMPDVRSSLARKSLRRLPSAPPLFFCASLFTLLFLAVSVVCSLGAAIPVSVSRSAPLGSYVAIADFDGDARPDVVRVEAASPGLSQTEYWIQFDLSASGRTGIRVAGPVGGLHITGRDVNGDHAIDLVVTSLWSTRPVAVLINDGHGRFSRMDPDELAGAFDGPDTHLEAVRLQDTEAVAVSCQVLPWVRPDAGLPYFLRQPSHPLARYSASVHDPLLGSRPDRAPPSPRLV